jgi:hypothetical protein
MSEGREMMSEWHGVMQGHVQTARGKTQMA